MDKILVVAQKEFKDGIRNRWIIAVTLIYAIFSLGLSYFGSAAAGSIGFSSLESTIMSLASLAVLLIPLVALMLAYNTFVGEFEHGTMLLLLTYPLRRRELLLGKFIGQGAILCVSAFLGFGFSAGVIISFADIDLGQALPAFVWFITSACLLGWVFIAIAYVISVSVKQKSQAAGLALLVWFFFVLVFDLSLLAVLVMEEGALTTSLVNTLLMLNPTDIFRIINYRAIHAEEFSGVLHAAQGVNIHLSIYALIMIVWISIPLFFAQQIFKRRVV